MQGVKESVKTIKSLYQKHDGVNEGSAPVSLFIIVIQMLMIFYFHAMETSDHPRKYKFE